jgi:hypothetical protein
MSGLPSRSRKPVLLAAAALAAMAATGGIAAQASGGAFQVPRQVLAAGATRAQGAAHVLLGTPGQSNTGLASAGAYLLSGGFHRSQPGADTLFGDGFE